MVRSTIWSLTVPGTLQIHLQGHRRLCRPVQEQRRGVRILRACERHQRQQDAKRNFKEINRFIYFCTLWYNLYHFCSFVCLSVEIIFCQFSSKESSFAGFLLQNTLFILSVAKAFFESTVSLKWAYLTFFLFSPNLYLKLSRIFQTIMISYNYIMKLVKH